VISVNQKQQTNHLHQSGLTAGGVTKDSVSQELASSWKSENYFCAFSNL